MKVKKSLKAIIVGIFATSSASVKERPKAFDKPEATKLKDSQKNSIDNSD